MNENINTNREDQMESIENRIWEYFSDLKLNNEQINKIKEFLSNELNQNENSTENLKIKEKKLLKKYKKMLEESTNIEEWIKKIENEIKEIKKDKIDINDKELNENTNNQTKMTTNKFEWRDIESTERDIESTERDIESTERDNDEKEKKIANKENNESFNKTYEALKKTSESYAKLNEKYKTTNPQELEEKKSNLPKETRKALEENNINIDDYVQYTLSRDKINELWGNDNSKETRDFLINLKNLEDNLWIRKETQQGLALTPDKKTFEENPQLNEFKDNDPDIAKLENTSYFWKEQIDLKTKNPEELKQIISPYQKMEKIYKDQRDFPKDDKFQEISKKIWEHKFDELKQEDLNYYTSSLDKLNWWITDYAKASAALAPQTWILKYLDSYTWLDKYSHQDMFWKSDKEYITKEDSTMCINWVINGNPLSFYYDTKDWETKISCDDILHIENDQYQIYDWKWKKPKSDLRINMPSIKDIVENIQNIDQNTYTKLLEWSSDIEEFQKKITNLINEKINSSFPENENIKTRMARFAEKNLAAQAFDSALVWRTEYKNKINDQKEIWLTPIKKVLLLIDNTTEKSTATELQEFRNWMKKLEWLIWKSQEEINKIKDPLLKENLLKLKQVKESNDYEKWEKTIIEFFSLFERRDPTHPEFKIDVDDFSTFIDLWEKDEETKKSTLENFSPEFQKNYNKLNPETKKIEEQGKTIKEMAEAQQEKDSEEADENLIAQLEMLESLDESSLW